MVLEKSLNLILTNGQEPWSSRFVQNLGSSRVFEVIISGHGKSWKWNKSMVPESHGRKYCGVVEFCQSQLCLVGLRGETANSGLDRLIRSEHRKPVT